jgi:hypothetical protein
MRKRPAAPIRLALALAAGFALAALVPGHAAAKTPCWEQVLNDWSNGRAIGSYPLHCYREAIRNLPEDLRDYSSAADDILAALQSQISHRDTRQLQAHGRADSSVSAHPSRSAYRRAIDNLGTSNADSLPMPLLVLASLGGALLLAAAGMSATKRIRGRRGPPSPPS